MNQLVSVTKDNDRLTVMGRELYEFLEVAEKYTEWMNRMIGYGFDENTDYYTISEKREIGIGKGLTNHQLTIDMAKEISMLQRTLKGKEARKYFLECEKKLKSTLPALSYKDALLALVAAEEEKEKLALERDVAIETKAEIGSRREATAMNKASQLSKEVNKLREEIGFNKEFATVKRMQIHTGRKFSWSPLRRYSKDNELEMRSVPDVNYGTVKAYNKEAWYAVYDIDLEEIFN
jgi:anti-repressor protein